MKKLIACISTLCLSLVCGVTLLVGCGDSHKPDDIVGVYNLKQMEIYYANQEPHTPGNFYEVNYENNENEAIKELSRIVYDNYRKYQYAVTKGNEGFLFEKRVLDFETGTYITKFTPATSVVWQEANNKYILKSPEIAILESFELNNGDVNYVGATMYVNSSSFEVQELKDFMRDHNISTLSIIYTLEK